MIKPEIIHSIKEVCCNAGKLSSFTLLFLVCVVIFLNGIFKLPRDTEEQLRISSPSKQYDAVLMRIDYKEHHSSGLIDCTDYELFLVKHKGYVKTDDKCLYKSSVMPSSVEWNKDDRLSLVRSPDDYMVSFKPIWNDKVFIKLLSAVNIQP